MKTENLNSKKEKNSKYSIFNIQLGKKLKATSLVEVIVVLAIVSLTIVSAMNLVIRSASAIKDSEIQDTAHGVLLKALEAIKSQENVKISSDLPVANMSQGNTYKFSLSDSPTGKLMKWQPTDNQPSITTCDASSPYYVPGLSLNICLKLEVIPRTPVSSAKYYEIKAKVSYVTGRSTQKLMEEEYKTYRYFNFTN